MARENDLETLATTDPSETAEIPGDRVGTGVQWLDVILRGGLPRNRLYLVTGDPGTGKTTFGTQFLIEGKARSESGLYITLAETRTELMAAAKSHGMDLSGIEIYEVSPAEEHDRPEHDYTALHPAEIELGESLEKIVKVVERVKPQRVVIDSLTEIRLMAREPVRYRRQIISLKNFLIRCGCTVLFIDDPQTRGTGDTQLQTICHGVVRFERLTPEYGQERRRMEVVKMRGVNFYGGWHDYVIQTGGMVIWPRLVASDHRRQFEMTAVPSGIQELDDMLGGGPDRGTTMLIIGAAGVGKSSLCLQYSKASAERGEYFAWFSFDERLGTIYKRAEEVKFNLKQLCEAGRCSIEQIDPGALSPGEFMQRVRRHVERFGARHLVIDSLNGYLNAMPGERFLIIQMHELPTYLSRMGVLTQIVVAQHGMIGMNVSPPIDLSYLSDTVAYLRYFEHAGEVRRAISIVKKRGAFHEGTIRELRLSSGGMRVGAPLKDFQGVLSGEPRYVGEMAPLLKQERDQG